MLIRLSIFQNHAKEIEIQKDRAQQSYFIYTQCKLKFLSLKNDRFLNHFQLEKQRI